MLRITLLLCLTASAAVAQTRYQLAQRLERMERAWEAQTDPAARARALPHVERAVQLFFRFQLAAAGQAIDRGRRALAGQQPSWADRVALRMQTALLDPDVSPTVDLELFAFTAGPELPEGARAEITLGVDGHLTKPLGLALAKLPAKLPLPLRGLPEGDHPLRIRLFAGAREVGRVEGMISLVRRLEPRLKALAAPAGDGLALDRATLAGLARELRAMQRTRSDIDRLAWQRLTEAEAIARALHAGRSHLGAAVVGERWLAVPGRGGRGATPTRVMVPPAAERQLRPVVIALHGAGGNEHMFPEGYGFGMVSRLCRARGWILLSPRLSMFGGVDCEALLDGLTGTLPIDRERVVVIGHSMGARAAVSAVGRAPQRYRALVALGGGGSVRDAKALRDLPLWVGAGDRDFGRSGAESLARALAAGGAKPKLDIVPACEHLLIVQMSLRKVFRWLDQIPAMKPPQRKRY